LRGKRDQTCNYAVAFAFLLMVVCSCDCQVGQERCKACSVGYYQEKWAQTMCLPCVPGTIAPDMGSTSCSPCVSRTYQDLWAQDRCKPCQLPCGLECAPCFSDSGLCPLLPGYCAIENECVPAGLKPIQTSLEQDACLVRSSTTSTSSSSSSWNHHHGIIIFMKSS
jgi:hypothetical protein